MKNMRRIKRMSRGAKRKKIPGMNLVSLMDVFTILVFFLLVNSANTEELERQIILGTNNDANGFNGFDDLGTVHKNVGTWAASLDWDQDRLSAWKA
jgi:hypothetical protein